MIHHYMIPVPALEDPPIYSNLITLLDKPTRYDNDATNAHHWTTEWVFNQILPRILSDFNLTKEFDKVNYIHKTNKHSTGDFSYHDATNCTIHFKNYTTGYHVNGNSTCLRGYNGINGCNTPYHKLFKGGHSVSITRNSTALTKRHLFICGDSMTIPLIPLLVPYFKTIIALDNRAYSQKQVEFNLNSVTDCFSMFTTIGWVEKHLPIDYMRSIQQGQ